MSEDNSDLDDLDDLGFDLKLSFRNHMVPIFFGLFGIVFIGLGIYLFASNLYNSGTSSGVEVLESATHDQGRKIIVEIAGAVKSPGVYVVNVDTRVDNLISLSGGFTDATDVVWVEKVLNRAAFVEDGQKIIIPSIDQQTALGSATENGVVQSISSDQGSSGTGLVNINSSTLSELESLWGIGPVIGQNIIDQRPYSSVEELLTRKILKSNVYERNKDLLTVF